MKTDEITVRVIVTGRVTGVGFRFSTRTEARHYPGLKGYVRNLGPGKVECLLQGAPADVRAMRRWLREGPDYARVDTFESEQLETVESYPPFEISF